MGVRYTEREREESKQHIGSDWFVSLCCCRDCVQSCFPYSITHLQLYYTTEEKTRVTNVTKFIKRR
jgi:hypothetical protein